MRITHTMSAEGGIFAATAFDGQIGKEVPLRVGSEVHQATVVEAAVRDGGRYVDLTLDVPDGLASLLGSDAAEFSIPTRRRLS